MCYRPHREPSLPRYGGLLKKLGSELEVTSKESRSRCKSVELFVRSRSTLIHSEVQHRTLLVSYSGEYAGLVSPSPEFESRDQRDIFGISSIGRTAGFDPVRNVGVRVSHPERVLHLRCYDSMSVLYTVRSRFNSDGVHEVLYSSVG